MTAVRVPFVFVLGGIRKSAQQRSRHASFCSCKFSSSQTEGACFACLLRGGVAEPASSRSLRTQTLLLGEAYPLSASCASSLPACKNETLSARLKPRCAPARAALARSPPFPSVAPCELSRSGSPSGAPPAVGRPGPAEPLQAARPRAGVPPPLQALSRLPPSPPSAQSLRVASAPAASPP